MKFVNCSNHPSSGWPSAQKEAAQRYGDIVDVAFPSISATANSDEIDCIVENVLQQIFQYKPSAVMCMGEFVSCYRLVKRLKERDVLVLASCSERKAKEYIDKNGVITKESVFEFKGFREY